jgi:hypothetical protein
MLIKSRPAPVTFPVPSPDSGGGEIYGEYVAAMAGCEDCHTRMNGSKKDIALLYAGGRLFATPYGTVVSPNITPDKETGIGNWGMVQFLERMEKFRQYEKVGVPSANPGQFTMMPWAGYARLNDEDIESLFLFIKAQGARNHKVQVHPVANIRQPTIPRAAGPAGIGRLKPSLEAADVKAGEQSDHPLVPEVRQATGDDDAARNP